MTRPVSLLCLAASLACVWSPARAAGEKPAKPGRPGVKFSGTDVSGKVRSVPASGKPSVLLFVRPDQEQSRRVQEAVAEVMDAVPSAQVLVVLSGPTDPIAAKTLAGKQAWPVVLDPDFKIVGLLRVRVWPTTIVVQADGQELARLSGMSPSYARDLGAYLSFASGKITHDALLKLLATSDVVADTRQQMAHRHLRVARRLLEKGLVAEAHGEARAGLKLQPDNPRLQSTLARVLLLQGKGSEAGVILDKLDERSSLVGEIRTLKGAVLVAARKWDDAIPVLQTAVRLNTQPSEAYYFLGVAYQHKEMWTPAAQAFRRAFEATPAGRHLSLSAPSRPAATTQAATRPATPVRRPTTHPAAPRPATKPTSVTP